MNRRQFYESWYAHQEREDRVTQLLIWGRETLEEIKATNAMIQEWLRKREENE